MASAGHSPFNQRPSLLANPAVASSTAKQDQTPPTPSPQARAWRVIHACDSIRSVAELVEAQIIAGMRPFVLTGDARPRPGSLLETWNEVRAWRSHLEGTDATTHPLQSSVVHAHSFSAAMAAVRAGLTTVYDVHACVEDFAVTAGQCTERSWLARSFRTAEEFVLPRAGAVVVHSALMRKACVERGVEAADLFLVPTPLHLPASSDSGWLRRAFDFSDDIVTIFARPTVAEDETLLRAFAQVAAEVPGARLFVAVGDDQSAQLRRFAHEHAVEDAVFFLSREDEQPALEAADIVLAGWPVFPDNSSWGRIHALTVANSGTALSAMAHGRCLLAADCSPHRDITPQGRGCLWYGSSGYGTSGYGSSASSSSAASAGNAASFGTAVGNAASTKSPADAFAPHASACHTKDKARELAHRLAFLARNPDFRHALAENARQHLTQTRDPERIGKMYREVYQHAEVRLQRGDDAPGQTPILIPAQNAV